MFPLPSSISLANVNGKIINAKSEEMQRNGFDKNSVAAYKYAVNNASPEYRTGAIDANVSSSVDTSVLSKSENPSTVIDQVKGQLQFSSTSSIRVTRIRTCKSNYKRGRITRWVPFKKRKIFMIKKIPPPIRPSAFP